MRNLRFATLVAIVLLLGWFVVPKGDAALRVTFFDIGQGDSALVSTPKGMRILIDGGPDRTVLTKLGEALPWNERTIDLVVLSHPHADHITGLTYVLERYRVKRILMTDAVHTTPEYARFLELIRDRQIPVTLARAGQAFTLEDGVSMEVFWPQASYEGVRLSDLNVSSIVNRVRFRNTSVLFTGDTPIENEEAIVASGADISSQILKVGHQGSRTSSGEEFLRAVAPEVAVISVGKDNQFGHPHAEVVERLERMVPTVLRTDKDGDVRFESDGTRWARR